MNIEPYKSLHSVILEVQAAAKPTKPAEKKLGSNVAATKKHGKQQAEHGEPRTKTELLITLIQKIQPRRGLQVSLHPQDE